MVSQIQVTLHHGLIQSNHLAVNEAWKYPDIEAKFLGSWIWKK